MTRSRRSGVACPVCKAELMQPDYRRNKPNWDCFGCGMSMPGRQFVEGIDLINFARKLDKPQEFLTSVQQIDINTGSVGNG